MAKSIKKSGVVRKAAGTAENVPSSSSSARREPSASSTSAPAFQPARPADDARIQAARFVTVLPAIPEEDLGLLPHAYDVDRIYAVPRDPEKVFATWDISVDTRRRAASCGLGIRFIFDDGGTVVTDTILPGTFQYYCAVPDGMTSVVAEIGLISGDGLEVVATSARVGLAIAFVRTGEPVFARVDRDVPLAAGRESVVKADAPAALPCGGDDEPGGGGGASRAVIGYMPVSGRK